MDRSGIFQDSFSDSNKSPRILKGFSSHFRNSPKIFQDSYPIPRNLHGFFRDSSGFFGILFPIPINLQGFFEILIPFQDTSSHHSGFFFPIPRDYQGFSRILNDPQPSRGHPSPNKRRLDNKRREAASEFHLLVNKFCSILNLFA